MKPNHPIQMVLATTSAVALIAAAFLIPPRRPIPPPPQGPSREEIEKTVRLEVKRFLIESQKPPAEPSPTPAELALKNRAAASSPKDALALILESSDSLPPGRRAEIILPLVASCDPEEAVHWYREHWEDLRDGPRGHIKAAIIGAVAKTGNLDAAISAMEELERKSSPIAWRAIAENAITAQQWLDTLGLFREAMEARLPYDRAPYLDEALPGFAESLRQLPFADAAPCLEELESAGEPFDQVLQFMEAPAAAAETGRWLDYLRQKNPSLFERKASLFVGRWITHEDQITAAKSWVETLPAGDQREGLLQTIRLIEFEPEAHQ